MDAYLDEYSGFDEPTADGTCTQSPSAAMIGMMGLSLALTLASCVKTLTAKPPPPLAPYETFMSTADDRLETRA